MARYIEDTGRDLKNKGEEISQTVGMISSDIDLRIFIESNRSVNGFIQKEEFQPYSQSKVDIRDRVRKRTQDTAAGKTPADIKIDDNYINTSSL